MFYVDLSIIEK